MGARGIDVVVEGGVEGRGRRLVRLWRRLRRVGRGRPRIGRVRRRSRLPGARVPRRGVGGIGQRLLLVIVVGSHGSGSRGAKEEVEEVVVLRATRTAPTPPARVRDGMRRPAGGEGDGDGDCLCMRIVVSVVDSRVRR